MNELSKFLKFMYVRRVAFSSSFLFLLRICFAVVFFTLSLSLQSQTLFIWLSKYLSGRVVQILHSKDFHSANDRPLYDPSNLLSIIPKTRLSSGANSVCYLSLRSSLSLSLSSSLSLLSWVEVCACVPWSKHFILYQAGQSFFENVWERKREILCAFYCPSW